MALFHGMSELWIQYLWPMSWRVSILIMLVWCVERLSFRASSLFRYWLWSIVLLRLLLPVNLTMPGGLERYIENSVGIGITDITSVLPINAISDRFRFQGAQPAPMMDSTNNSISIEPSGKAASVRLHEYLGIIWLSMFLVIGVLVIVRIFRVRSLVSRCMPITSPDLRSLVTRLMIEMGIRRPVGLFYLESDTLDIPSVIGIVRTGIYLPRHIVDEWSPEDIEPVLLHELAHVKRHDLLVNLLQVIVQAVYFFHPLVWLANSRLRRFREEVCDDIAVNRLGAGRKQYTLSILRVMEESLREPSLGLLAISLSEKRNTLRERITRIMNDRYRANAKLTVDAIITLIIVGMLGMSLSCEQSPLKENNNVSGTAVSMDSGSVDAYFSENGLMHISMALTNPQYPTEYSFRVAAVSATGRELQPPEDHLIGAENVIEAVNKFTRIDASYGGKIPLDSPSLFDTQVVFITSNEPFSLTGAESKSLGNYLRNGGFTLIDNGSQDTTEDAVRCDASFRQMLKDALGSDAVFLPIENKNQLFHCLFDFDDGEPWGSIPAVQNSTTPYFEGIWLDNRLAAVYSNRGYMKKWIENSEVYEKFGLNMVVYGFIQGNEIIQNEFRGKQLPEFTFIEIPVKIVGDDQYDVDGVQITSADLLGLINEKIGQGIPEYTYGTVVLYHTPETKVKYIQQAYGIIAKTNASSFRVSSGE